MARHTTRIRWTPPGDFVITPLHSQQQPADVAVALKIWDADSWHRIDHRQRPALRRPHQKRRWQSPSRSSRSHCRLKTLTAGTYTFKVTNKGKFAHNLIVDGAGVQDKATPTLAPGSTGDLTVSLQKGSYEFYCSVDGHKEMGMDVTVQVT
jgi:plastocyanin